MVEAAPIAPFRSAQAERRYLTILFCDLVGYTRLSEQLDPEDLQGIQRQYQSLVRTVMERYRGFVARFSGDGVLVYFGYPTAHENDAERAVRASVELIKRLGDFNSNVREQPVPELAIRIGIHTGLVVIGSEETSAGWQEHSVIGEAANLAARLQEEASPNSILISRETLELVEGYFTVESAGAKRLKGLTRSVFVYKVKQPLPITKQSHAPLHRGATRMIGRDAMIDRLHSHWNETILRSRCSTVQIIGEAGVGKTRLVLEFTRQPELAEANIRQLFCHEIFATTPLYAVGTFLSSRIGLTTDDHEATLLEKVSAFLNEFSIDDAENMEIVRSLLSLGSSGVAEAIAPTPLILKQKQFAFIVGLIEQAARTHPLLLWLDDAQWLDPSSAELLLEIVSRLAHLPILVLLTLRHFPRTPALPEPNDIVNLEQLGRQECLELARLVPGAQSLPDQALARAVEAADGIPLFVEQLVLSLIDRNAAVPSAGQAQTNLPLTLTELLSERLDRLPHSRRVVQAAACIGRSFTPDFLGALLRKQGTEVLDPLGGLVGAEILRPRQDSGELHYEFRHALLQRMAYESMLQQERRAMHGRIVEVIKQHGEFGPAIPEMIAHHLTAAGNFPDGIKAWLDAGISASRRSAHTEAVDHLRRGLDLLGEIAQPELRRQLELQLQVALIGSITALRGPMSAELSTCCERGLQLCEEEGSTPLVFPFLFGKYTFTLCRAQLLEAMSLAELFLSLAERNAYESGRVIAHRMMGMALLAQGRAREAKGQLERSLALYRHERDAPVMRLFGEANPQVRSQGLLSLTLFCIGDVDEALQSASAAIRAADMLRHPYSTTIALSYVGWVFGLCGAPEELMHEARRMMSIAEQHRLGPMATFGSAFAGWALCEQGHLNQGIAVMEQAVNVLETVELRFSLSAHLANLADAKRRNGDFRSAEELCARALQMVSDSGERWYEPEVRRIAALIANDLRPNDRGKTEELLRTAVECARNLSFLVFEQRSLQSLKEFLGSAHQDPSVEARIGQLSHLQNLDRRVAATVLRDGPRGAQI